MESVFTNSSIADDFLGVSIEGIVEVSDGGSVTARVDLTSTTTHTDAEIQQAFTDGLTDMYLNAAKTSLVVSASAGEPGNVVVLRFKI